MKNWFPNGMFECVSCEIDERPVSQKITCDAFCDEFLDENWIPPSAIPIVKFFFVSKF